MTPDEGREIARTLVHPDLTALRQAVADAYGDAYVAGQYAAAQQTGATVIAGLDGVEAPSDWAAFWSAWTPGDQAAASLLDSGGLARLLARVDVTVQGIAGSTLDRLGGQLAAGVARGSSVDTLARSLSSLVDDPARAFMIADTECARAVTESTLAGYADAGVEAFTWVASPGACPECEAMAEDSPHPLGDERPPLHPLCRCAVAPVTDG